MPRGLLPVALVVAALLVAGCSGEDTAADTTGAATTTTVAAETAGKIALRAGRTNAGPWEESLSLEHGEDGVPTEFFVCAAWDEARLLDDCNAATGAELPEGTVLRLEQRPAGTALTQPDSPGWGTVGTSDFAELHVPLSDFVSGVDTETATYRVTLRRREGGPALATSNQITVAWSE